MSKVKIQGDADGTGVLTITAPATNTDRTITLPDTSATLVTTDGGNITVVNVNNGSSTWAPTSFFPLSVKGSGDGGMRAIGAVGNSSGQSSWFGSTTTPQLAINTENSTAAFWLNNGTTSTGSWMKMIDFSYNGTTNFYGGNGGAAISVRNGGDIQLFNAENDRIATMWADAPPTGSGGGNGDLMWFGSISMRNQRCVYDRSWDNYPSITVLNHTDQGPQGEFRIHGSNGVSGGDFGASLRCDGGFITGSDARRKLNIEAIGDALQIVQQLNGKKFNITNREGVLDPIRGEKKQYGFIAQECKDIIPEAVTFYPESDEPNENGWASAYSIDYQSLVPVLVEAIKQQQDIITQLTQRVENLENN
jgi:hypothetical protein